VRARTVLERTRRGHLSCPLIKKPAPLRMRSNFIMTFLVGQAHEHDGDLGEIQQVLFWYCDIAFFFFF
jgi:hypothetical protein